MHQVSRHEGMLYKMDTKMFIMNKTIQNIMIGISFLWYESDLMAYFQARILRLHSSLYALKGDIDLLYEYMRALATQELNLMIIPPDILKKCLIKLQRISSLMLDSDLVRTQKLIYGLTMITLN